MAKLLQCKTGTTLVDDVDYDYLSRFRWSKANGYIQGWINKRQVMMHRIIMNPPENLEIDHINGIRNDNRRANLRICTHLQNCRNGGTGDSYGVTYRKDRKRWYAQLYVKKKCTFFKSCATKTEAQEAIQQFIANNPDYMGI